MRWSCQGVLAAVTVLAVAALTAAVSPVDAQVSPGGGINPGRDCQTILQCRFRRGGVYRGCISAYSCRQCRFVTARDCGTRQRRVCQRLVCSWR